MQNPLNSVLIEGTINGDIITRKDKNVECAFYISQDRSVKRNDELVKEKRIINLLVNATGTIAKKIIDKGKPDTGVRIVGILCQKPDSFDGIITYLQAEHVELRE